jgi:hypothetical protein
MSGLSTSGLYYLVLLSICTGWILQPKLRAWRIAAPSPFPVPFWLPQRPQRNTTFLMNRLAKDLCASGALLFHTNDWTGREAGQQILG